VKDFHSGHGKPSDLELPAFRVIASPNTAQRASETEVGQIKKGREANCGLRIGMSVCKPCGTLLKAHIHELPNTTVPMNCTLPACSTQQQASACFLGSGRVYSYLIHARRAISNGEVYQGIMHSVTRSAASNPDACMDCRATVIPSLPNGCKRRTCEVKICMEGGDCPASSLDAFISCQPFMCT